MVPGEEPPTAGRKSEINMGKIPQVEEKSEINAKLKSRYLEVTRQLWSALRCG
jgi:hypothetical protein